MMVMPRRVVPELLDDLDPSDPRARHSRRDLRRVHRVMRSVSILRQAVAGLRYASPPRSIIELGAGDGTLLLRLARALKPRWAPVELTLLDRQDLLAPETREAYLRIGWQVTVLKEDVLTWARTPAARHYDLCIANLFLHHFEAFELDGLLSAVAARTAAFIGCEPRRDWLGRLGSRSVGLLGANAVTREDSVKSVAAGFRGGELAAIWRHAPGDWRVREYRAWPFSHCLTARRAGSPPVGGQA